jgi:hypothetical protein
MWRLRPWKSSTPDKQFLKTGIISIPVSRRRRIFQMDGIARVLASGMELPPVKMADGSIKIYKLGPFRLSHFGEVEQYLLKDRKTASEIAVAACKKMLAEGMAELAEKVMANAINEDRRTSAQNKIPIEEVQRFIDTREGLLMTMRLCLSEYHPNITNNEIILIFEQFSEKDIKDWRDRVAGSDVMGNSTGSASLTGAKTDPQVRAPNLGTGERSSAISPILTDGLPSKSDD